MRETVDVHVLELEVAVLDRQGNPVRGLTREDFEVRHGKKRVEVTNFYAVERGAIVDEWKTGNPACPPDRQDCLSPTTMMATSLFILIDDTRLGQRAKVRTIEAVKEYVRKNVGLHTSAVLARYNGSLDVRTRPTERPGPLLAELDLIAQSPAMLRDRERQMLIQSLDESLNGVYQEFDMEARFRQLWRDFNEYAERQRREIEPAIDALREAVRVASAFEGRKVVLYATEGLPLMPGIEVFDYWDRATTAIGSGAIPEMQSIARDMFIPMEYARYDCSRLFRRVVQEAQKSNVLFFALDAGGVRASELTAHFALLDERQQESDVRTAPAPNRSPSASSPAATYSQSRSWTRIRKRRSCSARSTRAGEASQCRRRALSNLSSGSYISGVSSTDENSRTHRRMRSTSRSGLVAMRFSMSARSRARPATLFMITRSSAVATRRGTPATSISVARSTTSCSKGNMPSERSRSTADGE